MVPDSRIVKHAPYGQFIELTCINHPDLRWSTKNIGYIGARSIFYRGEFHECDCPCRDLRPVERPDLPEVPSGLS